MDQLAELYQRLLESQLAFIQRGERSTADIYDAVQRQFPDLCNNDVICSDVCTEGTRNPEWQHRVRAALQVLKTEDGSIRKGVHGYWKFC